jgi:hypothetical protein
MPLWGFSRESNQVAAGANTLAGRAKGYQAPYYANDARELAEKRNVIATKNGWVRREVRVMPAGVENTTRIIDQILVAAAPNDGTGIDYTSNTYLGKPDIAQIYVKLNANGYISANVSANLYVVFNTPIAIKASGNALSITISNTSAGNSGVARFLNNGSIVNANNTLVFKMPKLQGNTVSGAVTTGTYKIGSQTISVTGNPLYNPDDGAIPGAFANLVITGATSNNLLDTIGNRIVTFQVRAGG